MSGLPTELCFCFPRHIVLQVLSSSKVCILVGLNFTNIAQNFIISIYSIVIFNITKVQFCATIVQQNFKNIRKHMIHQKTKPRKINVLQGFVITYDSLKRRVQDLNLRAGTTGSPDFESGALPLCQLSITSFIIKGSWESCNNHLTGGYTLSWIT